MTDLAPPSAARALRELRARACVTQRRAAAIAGLSPVAFGTWERGERAMKVERLVQVAIALGEDPSEVLRWAIEG